MAGHRHRRSRAVGGAIGALLLACLAGSGVALAADQSVDIAGFAYSPSTVNVNVGDTVTWTNADAQAHTASANDGSWDTGVVAGGGSAAVTFSAAGTFPYHCDIHPAMTGTLVVQGAGGGGRPPATDTGPLAVDEAGSWTAGPVGAAIAGLAGLVGLLVVLRRTGEQLRGGPGR